MALFIDTSQYIAYSVVGDVFLLPGVTIWSDFDPTIDEVGGTTFLRIDGTVLCSGSAAVSMSVQAGTDEDTIVIGATGAVHATSLYAGIEMVGAFQQIINDGQVSGRNGIAVDSMLFGNIANGGTVTGIDGAAISAVFSNAVTITNSGTIRGTSGIELFDSYATILNSGSIIATDAGGFAISAGAGVGANIIRNTGRIEASQTAINGSASTETVVNAGEILGDVVLAGSADEFRGRNGTLAGALSGGDGNDSLASGLGDDIVQGDAGSDILRGNVGSDTLYGGQGGDVLRGDDGDDRLFGGGGSDDFVFTRGSGDDTVEDFANGQDQIDLSALRIAGFAAVSSSAVDRAGGMLIDLASSGGTTIFITGFTKAQFDAGDVIL